MWGRSILPASTGWHRRPGMLTGIAMNKIVDLPRGALREKTASASAESQQQEQPMMERLGAAAKAPTTVAGAVLGAAKAQTGGAAVATPPTPPATAATPATAAAQPELAFAPMPSGSIFKRAWYLVKTTISAWSDDYAPSMGAALSYYTLFSLAPM